MAETMEVVMLKGGIEAHGPLVNVTMLSLRDLLKTKAMVFYELVMLCRDRDHKLFGNTGEQLYTLGLVAKNGDERFQVHQATKEIVLAAVEGDGLEMTLGNPVATPQRIP